MYIRGCTLIGDVSMSSVCCVNSEAEYLLMINVDG